MATRLTLDHCGQRRHFQNLAAGEYQIEYTDSTHLQPTEWVRLATIEVRSAAVPGEGNNTEQFYTLKKHIGDLPGKPDAAQKAKNNNDKPDPLIEYNRRIRVVEDTLSLALGRVGLIAPEVPSDLLEHLFQLDKKDGVVIIPDTNALHNGAVHWLLRVLSCPSVWLMPVVASMTTIQTRDATIKGLVNKAKINNLGQALRSRGLVNGALGLLERNKGRCQVIEIDPSLLRYQKVASSTGADPDQSDVLEDRLIIEAIHGVLRSMRSRIARRVVTSDVNIARVLAGEGIETLFVPSITLGEAPVACLRFDALARSFVGAPLRATLWELAHAFGSIRLMGGGAQGARLDCYWPGKSPAEWGSETLDCDFQAFAGVPPKTNPAPDAHKKGTTPSAVSKAHQPDKPANPPERPAADTEARQLHTVTQPSSSNVEASGTQDSARIMPASTIDETRTTRKGHRIVLSRDAVSRIKALASSKRAVPITAPLPRASLVQMLRLLGVAQRLGGGTAEDFVSELRAEPISAEKAKRPLEILRRMRLVEQNNSEYRPTEDVGVVDAALRSGDLDALSTVMERFVPYQAFRQALMERSKVRRADVASVVQSLIGPAGIAESDRIPRFHILLGQAWTDGEWIVDGSNRPTDRDAVDAFEEAFYATASVGIAKMQNLLLTYCEITKMSPWAAKRQIEKFVAARMLSQFSFQSAAGAKPITRDEIVVGSLDRVDIEPVIIDRLYLGEQPVFTVEGLAR